MRAELNRIERIMAYLDGEMNKEDKVLFEKEMNENDSLKSDTKEYQILIAGFKNHVLKSEINQAKLQFKKSNLIRKVGIIGAIILVIASIIFVFKYFNGQQKTSPERKTNSSLIIKDSIKSNEVGIIQLPIQTFELNTKIDNIIETKEGIVIAIGANSFNSSSSKVIIKVQEALKPSDIILSGLSTTYKDSLLETSGMFVIEAFDGDKKIELIKDIIVEVPVLNEKEDYLLFDGVSDDSGRVTWTNPQPLEYYLQTFNVPSLNFYPPDFEPSLVKETNNKFSKVMKDSIYYSLEPIESGITSFVELKAIRKDEIRDGEIIIEDKKPVEISKPDTIRAQYKTNIILPSQIKAIWNERFNNTIIATKEFEERLSVLHKICGVSDDFNSIITPLTNDIEELDRRIIKYYGQRVLQSIQTKKKGIVRPNAKLHAELNDYYVKKQKDFADEAKASLTKKLKEQAQRQAFIDSLTIAVYEIRSKNATATFRYEFDRTMRYVCKALDIDYPTQQVIATANIKRVSARISTLGIKNIDRIVTQGMVNRTNIYANNRSNGKSVNVQMKEFKLDLSAYSQLKSEVFLIPDSLNSYIRLENNNGQYLYALNELLDYRLVVIATDGKKYYYFERGRVSPGQLAPELKEKELSSIKNKLDEGRRGPVFQSEQMFQELKLQTETIAFHNSKLSQSLALRQRLISTLYPCIYSEEREENLK
jgi:hypothetical protein